MNSKKKLGKLSEKQTHFINLFVAGIDVEDILDELNISANSVTNWMTTNPVFYSTLLSSIYLKELSLYIRQLNLRLDALKELELYVEAGNADAIQTVLSNVEKFPEFNINTFSALKIKKSNMNDFLKSIETDLNIPPWRYRKDYDDDDMPPF
tara:strand:- start:747 stop:1202 length:456 start_codon:yes stop_codon:yes gene_type:complete